MTRSRYPGFGHPARPVMHALAYQPTRRVEQTPGDLGLDYVDLWIPTSDGETLHAWWMPASLSIGHILFAHGNAGNIGDRVPIFALLTEAGFDVLAFDYRGYGHSTGRPNEHGTVQDGVAARRTLLERPEVDPERILYLGNSLGGAVALALAVAHPPAGLMLMSTFTSLRAVARSLYPFLPAPLIPNAYPSLRRIGRLHSPLLLMHGDHDELISPSHADRLYTAAPEPKRLVMFPGAGHDDLIATAPSTWLTTVTEWARDVALR